MKHLISDIKENAITYGSIPFWSWNDKLEEKELRRQIRRMHELQMRGFFMHARGGLETEYLSEDWYACTRVCVEEAEKLGMEAWAYDENGWPSGFAGGKLLEDPRNQATYLSYEAVTEYPTDENVLGVYVLRDGKLTRVFEACGETYHVIRQKYDSSYVDTLDAEVTDRFLAVTHREYQEKIGFSKHMPEIGKAEFVVGKNIHAPSQYVTWECSNGNNYFWGHYFSDRSEALRDMYSRAEAEISFIKNSIHPTKKREEREER